MFCSNCGKETPAGAFCAECGAKLYTAASAPVTPEAPVQPVKAAPAAPVRKNVVASASRQQPTTVRQAPARFTEDDLPEKYRPLSSWAYFGLQLLFSIPLVGFILLIIYSMDNSNINRRNFARSYWCALLVGLIISVITFLVVLIVMPAALESMF